MIAYFFPGVYFPSPLPTAPARGGVGLLLLSLPRGAPQEHVCSAAPALSSPWCPACSSLLDWAIILEDLLRPSGQWRDDSPVPATMAEASQRIEALIQQRG